MRVQDLLEKKGKEVFTISGDESVDAAIDKLNETKSGALIVVESGQTVGINVSRQSGLLMISVPKPFSWGISEMCLFKTASKILPSCTYSGR